MHRVIVEDGHSIGWYLDKEQELLASVTEPTLMTWRVGPTVIYGRHQDRDAEVNMAYCREHHIEVYQRQSGGGAVYADRGNLMTTYVEPSPHSQEVFARYMTMMATALRNLGYDAVTTEHNDILVEGRKVSGTACYTSPTGTIVHGTLLIDVNLEQMVAALTPSEQKLKKHAVASVRQRVRNLTDLNEEKLINILLLWK